MLRQVEKVNLQRRGCSLQLHFCKTLHIPKVYSIAVDIHKERICVHEEEVSV